MEDQKKELMEQIKQINLSDNINVRLIKTNQLYFKPEYRKYCEQNTCKSYGSNYGCPPDAGTVKELISKVKSYRYALVYQLIETDAKNKRTESPVIWSPASLMELRRAHQRAGDQIQEILENDKIDYYPIGSGNCILCDTCSKLNQQPCRHPNQIRRSLSAFCIDVSRMAEVCQMCFGDGVHTITYFGLFCI